MLLDIVNWYLLWNNLNLLQYIILIVKLNFNFLSYIPLAGICRESDLTNFTNTTFASEHLFFPLPCPFKGFIQYVYDII